MEFTVRSISDDLQEMKVDEIETGTMDKKAAIGMAVDLILAADSLLWGCGLKEYSRECTDLAERTIKHAVEHTAN